MIEQATARVIAAVIAPRESATAAQIRATSVAAATPRARVIRTSVAMSAAATVISAAVEPAQAHRIAAAAGGNYGGGGTQQHCVWRWRGRQTRDASSRGSSSMSSARSSAAAAEHVPAAAAEEHVAAVADAAVVAGDDRDSVHYAANETEG